MGYTNTQQERDRYTNLRQQYGDALRQRNSAISIAQCRVDVAEAALQEINDDINKLNNSGVISYQVTQERYRLYEARRKATDRLNEAKKTLAIVRVGKDAINEVADLVTHTRRDPAKIVEDELDKAADAIAGEIVRKHEHKRIGIEYNGH